MKTAKLKPVYLPNDDILVCPPQFIDVEDEIQPEKPKNKTFSSTEQLKTILRGRQMRKSINLKNLTGEDEEEDIVKKLSEWKCTDSPKSAIKRKFTFKRGTTSIKNNDSKASLRSISLNKTAPHENELDSIATMFKGLVALEKYTKKKVELESKQITEDNLLKERNIKHKINIMNQEMQQLKTLYNENLQKQEKFKKEFEELQKNHENSLGLISKQEAQELLLSEKGKKKLLKPGEESRNYMKKEKLRQQKQEVHKKYQEGQEYYSTKIADLRAMIEIVKASKQTCKKNLINFREELVSLYCRALKDGKDLRSDGLRWIIKSLWKMNECVPLSSFPKFFDEDSYQFLLTMAEKDLELESLTKKLEDLRVEIRSKRKKCSISTERELYRTVRNRLRSISQSSVGQNLDGVSVDEGEHIERKKDDFEENGSFLELSRLRGQIGEIHENIKQMSLSEVKRITEIYKSNIGESGKFGVFHIIRCLVGDKVREFNKYTRTGVKKNFYRISKKIY
jgi:hypothetical protein